MKYKIGDKVRIKSWDELVDKFGINVNNNISIAHKYLWNKFWDDKLSKDRIINIAGIDESGDYLFEDIAFITDDMIKGYANECYLQQIKEEMDEV